MATTSSMFMYSLTIQPPSGVSQAILGQFAGTKEQQIVTASCSRLSMFRFDSNAAETTPILTHDVFGVIRGLAAFRLAGSVKDYLIISSDSGRITIVEYIPAQNKWLRVGLETFGKSGVRRVVPGQYLAADPKGRACMIASIEKNKLVYVLNRNEQAQLSITSPLEAHKPQTFVLALAALDVGYENPIFATLELEYGDCDQDPTGRAVQDLEKQLVYYELDLGLNHVVSKWSDTVDRTASLLFRAPGGNDGPSGVLVCAEESITYRHLNQEAFRVPIPRRRGPAEDPKRKRCIVAGVMHRMKKWDFFFLLQTDDGDLFKVTLITKKDDQEEETGEVIGLRIKYFGTVPVASALCILKSGYLFVAAENGNHQFHRFEKLGDKDEEPEVESYNYSPNPNEPYDPIYFHPKQLGNLASAETMKSLNPLISLKALNLTDSDSPQLYAICGAGARSTFRTMYHGLQVSEIVPSGLPDVATAVWTTKRSKSDEYDLYIVLSFATFTIVLDIGETVEEALNTGFLSATATIAVQQMGEDSIMQIHARGIRQIHREGRIEEWPAPPNSTIVQASTNHRQVAIALNTGQIIYFELDDDDELREFEETYDIGNRVTCLSLGEVPHGRMRSSFLAIGCDDSTVRVLSLEPHNTLETQLTQALTSCPTALKIITMEDPSSGSLTPYLHVGLQSGVYLRTVIDEQSGDFADTRIRFLGPKPVKLFQVTVKGQSCVIALSTTSWLGYTDMQSRAYKLTPLIYTPMEWASNFSSEQWPEGIVGVHGKELSIFSVDDISNNIHQESVPLSHTPRAFVRHPTEKLFYVAESDYNVLSPSVSQALKDDQPMTNGDAVELPVEEYGLPKGQNHWSSCIQVVEPLEEKKVLETIFLDKDEAAVSLAVVPFQSQDDEPFLLVGTGKNMIADPPSHQGGFVHVYRFKDNGTSLDFIHKTKMDHPPRAMIPFQKKVAIGIGADLTLFDLGMKQLLRKAHCPDATPNMIVDLQTRGSRIVCSDVQESVTYVVYKPQETKLIPFVDDTIARWTTASATVDHDTTAGGDKFGNLWLVRCPRKVSEEADEEGSGAHLINERPYLGGTPNRLESMVNFYCQDIPMSIQQTPLVPGGRPVLLWAGLKGTVGILIPFQSRSDVDLMQNVENQLRLEDAPLAGRDHLIYRSTYVAVKGVIDGDLCERFALLETSKKERIAAEVDKSYREVERKLSDLRNSVAF